MALDDTILEDRIIDIMETEHAAANSDAVVGVEVTQTPQEDGTLESEIEYRRGTPPFDREGVRPLARAIAQAVVEHIASNAEITGTGVGADWRIS